MASDAPGDLHVGLVGRDREAAVLELCGDSGAARRLEVPQLVAERRFERAYPDREADGGKTGAVRPDLAVIRDLFHRAQGGRLGVGGRLGPDWDGRRWILPNRLVKR